MINNRDMGTVMQIGIGGVAEYMYLLVPNWQQNMHENVAPLLHVPEQFEKDDNWVYIGIDCDISSIYYMLAKYQMPNAYWISAFVTNEEEGLQFLSSDAVHHDLFVEHSPFNWNSSERSFYYTPKKSLSQIVQDLGITKLDVLVIDIEGHEVSIFENYDWRVRPTFIAVEFHHCYPDVVKISPEGFIKIFTDQGYKKITEEKTNTVEENPEHYTLELQFLLK